MVAVNWSRLLLLNIRQHGRVALSALLIVLFGLLIGCQSIAPASQSPRIVDSVDTSGATPGLDVLGSGNATNSSSPGLKTFTITLSNYRIEPNEIAVKYRDRVRLNVVNKQGRHGFSIPWFNVNTGEIPEGESRVVEFVASKKLTTYMRCSFYCGPEHAGMVGYVVVK